MSVQKFFGLLYQIGTIINYQTRSMKFTTKQLTLFVGIILLFCPCKDSKATLNGDVIKNSTLVKTEGNLSYRDLNTNGNMDIYEDALQPIEKRIDDLLAQINVAKTAGMKHLFVE